MTLRKAYNLGKKIGRDIAITTLHDGNGTLEEDEFVTLVSEGEAEHFRQFSPFEFTAREFNESRFPSVTWESYEDGVRRGATMVYREQMQNR